MLGLAWVAPQVPAGLLQICFRLPVRAVALKAASSTSPLPFALFTAQMIAVFSSSLSEEIEVKSPPSCGEFSSAAAEASSVSAGVCAVSTFHCMIVGPADGPTEAYWLLPPPLVTTRGPLGPR